jgi:gamma-glutamylcyclotransferase (GGCT)/AIG2-like uncharacterized protein YtfP
VTSVHIFLNGTAMSDGADHGSIAGSTFVGAARTAPRYRFYSVRDEFPGLVPDGEGASIAGEVYDVDEAVWYDALLPQEPVELVPGEIELEDGRTARAMILDLARLSSQEYRDITGYGGWRQYLATCPEATSNPRTS